jgi:hypothetical protein
VAFVVYVNIVTCMRFPWFNNVSTAITMDGRFLSYATILDGLSVIGGQQCKQTALLGSQQWTGVSMDMELGVFELRLI